MIEIKDRHTTKSTDKETSAESSTERGIMKGDKKIISATTMIPIKGNTDDFVYSS
jgi:hypothetical protein